MEAHLLVFLYIYVDRENAHRFGHDEGERAEIEGPAVVVLVLPVFVLLVTGIPGVAGNVDNNADDVAQAWKDERREMEKQEGRSKEMDYGS